MLEDDDPSGLMHALGVVARARGMTDVAHVAGLTREALYKSLRPNSQPCFDTIARVCRALGLKLTTQMQVRA
ncbi:MAG: addiction module antidote protein [Polaromonas sp.]